MSATRAEPERPVRLAFLGSPLAAVPTLEALVGAGHEVVVVVTQPDRRRGRGADLTPTPVKTAAARHGLAVTERVDDLLESQVDLGVVVAYGKLLKPHLLDRVPMVNAHFSLLPRWRGAAPVERAILAGDDETGVCLMKLDEGLDTGPVYDRVATPITEGETAGELVGRLAGMAAELVINHLETGLGEPVPQQGEPTYAAKIAPAELVLDFATAAVQLARVVRLGRAWTTVGGKRLIVWRSRPVGQGAPPGVVVGNVVGTGAGGLELLEVQPEGKGRMAGDAWARGAGLGPTDRLGG